MEPVPSGSVRSDSSFTTRHTADVGLQHPHAVERDAGHRAGGLRYPAPDHPAAEAHGLVEHDLSRRLRIDALAVQDC